MAKIKAGLVAVFVYLQANPGVVSLIVGQTLLVLAHFGLHLTADQLYTAAAVAVPILLAYFKGAETANKKAIVAEALKDSHRVLDEK